MGACSRFAPAMLTKPIVLKNGGTRREGFSGKGMSFGEPPHGERCGDDLCVCEGEQPGQSHR